MATTSSSIKSENRGGPSILHVQSDLSQPDLSLPCPIQLTRQTNPTQIWLRSVRVLSFFFFAVSVLLRYFLLASIVNLGLLRCHFSQIPHKYIKSNQIWIAQTSAIVYMILYAHNGEKNTAHVKRKNKYQNTTTPLLTLHTRTRGLL